MDARDGLKLSRLLLRGRVVEEVAAADLRAGEILEEARLAQRGMNLDVEVKSRRRLSLGGRLVQHHHVRERRAPQVVEPDEGLAQDASEVGELGGRKVGK